MGLDTSNPLSKTKLTYKNSWGVERLFFRNRASRSEQTARSNWVNLTEGEKYYIEASHLEGTGGDHMAVGVEIEKANTTGHHHAMKEIQYLTMENPNKVFEVSRITIDNPELGGNYKLNFQSPAMKYVPSTIIAVNSSAS